MSQELACASAAAKTLRQHGDVYLGYITAEREPFSAQQKPDISFTPARGPNAGKVFFVELRFFENGKLPPHYPESLREDRAFALEGAEGDYGGFAFATNVSVGRTLEQRLAANGIHYLGPVDSGDALAEKIRAWASRGTDQFEEQSGAS